MNAATKNANRRLQPGTKVADRDRVGCPPSARSLQDSYGLPADSDSILMRRSLCFGRSERTRLMDVMYLLISVGFSQPAATAEPAFSRVKP